MRHLALTAIGVLGALASAGSAEAKTCTPPPAAGSGYVRLEIVNLRAEDASCKAARRVARKRQQERLRDDGLQPNCKRSQGRRAWFYYCSVGRWRCTMRAASVKPYRVTEVCRRGAAAIRWRWRDINSA